MRAGLVMLVLLALPSALAHGDAASLDSAFTVESGGSHVFMREVHWHRIVGTVQSDTPIVLAVDGEVVAGPSTRLVLNHLVACCDAAWAEVTFAITNVGETPARVRSDLAILHDNLAVVVDNSEPGAWWQTLIIVLAVIVVPAWRARIEAPRAGDAKRWLLRGRVLHGAAWAAGIALALAGMAQIQSGPLVGSLAATAPFPSGGRGFMNTHSYVMLGLMATWSAAYACWSAARRRGSNARTDGALFAAGCGLVGASMFLELGGGWVPVVVGGVPAMAIVVDTLRTPAPDV